MTTSIATRTVEINTSIDDAMEMLSGKLDEAIDDMENGRVQSIEEVWKEIDSIQEVRINKRYFQLAIKQQDFNIVTVLRILQGCIFSEIR